MTLRAAVVGCGRIGAATDGTRSRILSHAEAYTASEGTDLVAFADPSPERLAAAGNRWSVKSLYTDISGMLRKESPEVVSLATPPETRLDLLKQVLEAPSVRAVLVEKPVASDPAAAAKVEALASRASAVVAVNYTRRYPPIWREAAALVRDGGIGRIQNATALYTGGVVNNGSHALDLSRWFFGDPIRVETRSDSPGEARLTYHGLHVTLVPLDADAANIFEFDVIGTEGRLVFRDQGHVLDRYGVDDVAAVHGFRQLARVAESRPTDLSHGIQHAIANVMDSLDGGHPPACTVADGRAALDLAFKILPPRPS